MLLAFGGPKGSGLDRASATAQPIPQALSGIASFAAGEVHSAVIADQGKVLYLFTEGTRGSFSVPNQLDKNEVFTKCAVGSDHTVALTSAGRVFAIGSNKDLQCGVPGKRDVADLTLVSGTADHFAVDVACACEHTLIVNRDGSVLSFGQGRDGQLGTGDKKARPEATRVTGIPSNITSVAAGNGFSLFLGGDGRVWSCGSGLEGALGHGNNDDTPVPLQIPNLPEIAFIAAGMDHSVFVAKDGRVFTCGAGEDGRLGHGDDKDLNVPAEVRGLPPVVAAGAGPNHTLFVASDGRLFACGASSGGQLGLGALGDAGPVETPTLVPGVTGATAASAGNNFSLVQVGSNPSAATLNTSGTTQSAPLTPGNDSFASSLPLNTSMNAFVPPSAGSVNVTDPDPRDSLIEELRESVKNLSSASKDESSPHNKEVSVLRDGNKRLIADLSAARRDLKAANDDADQARARAAQAEAKLAQANARADLAEQRLEQIMASLSQIPNTVKALGIK